jgi:hypothetical protein
MEIPGDLEGRVPVEVFESPWVIANPIRIEEVNGTPESSLAPGSIIEGEATEDSIIFQQLRLLGYME